MSIPYKEQLEIINLYRIKESQELRADCPFCGGKNTFTLTKRNGHTIWNCFKASCGAKGSKGGLPSVESLERSLQAAKGLLDVSYQPKKRLPPQPTILTNIENQPGVIPWLNSVNSYRAYEDKLVDIKYCPSDDRILFKMENPYVNINEDAVHGWIGRGKKNVNPKWRYYGDCRNLFIVRNRVPSDLDIAVVVEDVCSACAVGIVEGYVGVALLGTNLSEIKRQQLKEQFKNVLICLDPDAQTKGLQLMTSLVGHFEYLDMLVPPNDLKYFNEEELKDILSAKESKTIIARSKDNKTIT